MKINNKYNLFSKSLVAEYVLGVSPGTLNNYIKDGKLFEPYTYDPDSTSDNPRPYYTLADVMRISIILNGSIIMEKINNLLMASKVGKAYNRLDPHVHDLIISSFDEVKTQITTQSDQPVNLQNYLTST